MLKTKRFTLREPLQRDLAPMHEVYSDPLAMKYWSTAPHEDIAITQDLLDRRIKAWAAAPLNFQIDHDGQYIGNAGNFRDMEIGFMLKPACWRRGVLTEAMGTIIPYLFETTDFPKLTAEADPNNAASVGLLNSLGFKETHRAKDTLCINGTWFDSVYFEFLRP